MNLDYFNIFMSWAVMLIVVFGIVYLIKKGVGKK